MLFFFSQRVRIPDEKKSFGERNFKEEKVLNLKKFSLDKCVVATRAGDDRIYSIPVTTSMKLAHNPMSMKDKHVLDILPALYPLVNTSWGVVDPTQEALKTSMEAIPQPIRLVMDVWFNSEEGRSFMTPTFVKKVSKTQITKCRFKQLQNNEGTK